MRVPSSRWMRTFLGPVGPCPVRHCTRITTGRPRSRYVRPTSTWQACHPHHADRRSLTAGRDAPDRSGEMQPAHPFAPARILSVERAQRPANVVEIRSPVDAGSTGGTADVEAAQKPLTLLMKEPEPVPPPPGTSILDGKYRRELLADGSVKITVTRLRHEPDGTVTVLGKDELIVPADEVKLKGP